MVPDYALPGTSQFPQVEPHASTWPRCPLLKTIDFCELQREVDEVVQPYVPAKEETELAELRELFADREKPPKDVSAFLTNPFFFKRVPAGAVLSTTSGGAALPVSNGIELATLFEAETPGLWHQHILNVILDPTVPRGAGLMLSPPRQAVIWSALYIATSSALNAAWNYKWVAQGLDQVAYRRRPAEADAKLDVLYDRVIEFSDSETTGRIRRDRIKTAPRVEPGTPRHPAYPSGHSTYSAAASRVLGQIFSRYKDPRRELAGIDWKLEFDRLADNIGVARLHGGVHWRSDHDLGQTIGTAIGDLILKQLGDSAVPEKPIKDTEPRTRKEREEQAKQQAKKCGERPARADYAIDFTDAGIQQNLQLGESVSEDKEAPAAD